MWIISCLYIYSLDSNPFTILELLWVNVIVDTLGALALETNPLHDDLKKRKLVGRGGSIINNVVWRDIFGQYLYQPIVIWIS